MGFILQPHSYPLGWISLGSCCQGQGMGWQAGQLWAAWSLGLWEDLPSRPLLQAHSHTECPVGRAPFALSGLPSFPGLCMVGLVSGSKGRRNPRPAGTLPSAALGTPKLFLDCGHTWPQRHLPYPCLSPRDLWEKGDGAERVGYPPSQCAERSPGEIEACHGACEGCARSSMHRLTAPRGHH